MLESELREPVANWCASMGLVVAHEMRLVVGSPCDVVGFLFTGWQGRRRPRVELSIAIELKVEDAAGVINQARRNSYCVHQSFAAMPDSRIARMRPDTLGRFAGSGIGLLAVSPEFGVRVIVAPCHERLFNEATEMRICRNAWRRCRHALPNRA